MSAARRGGLGRGLAALIPNSSDSSPERLRREPLTEDEVMSSGSPGAKRAGARRGNSPAANSLGTGAKVGNRVPSVATIAASSATDFYFDPSPVPGATLRDLRPSEVRTNPKQPRQVFDAEALEELSHSIKEFGVLQPIVVRETPHGYELVMGERRLRASIAAGLDRIPAIVRDTADEAMLRDALLENIHRAQLNPLEEAAAYQQLLEEFGVTHDELASRIGRSRSQISNTIRLMNLSIPVQRRLAAGVLSAGHARALLALSEQSQQDELAARIVAEGLSVRATEELVSATIGRAPSKKKALRTKAASPDLSKTSERLSDFLDTHVVVDLGRRKGTVTIDFASTDDLDRIVALITARR
jgi:ParB family chromosome partitioning protein